MYKISRFQENLAKSTQDTKFLLPICSTIWMLAECWICSFYYCYTQLHMKGIIKFVKLLQENIWSIKHIVLCQQSKFLQYTYLCYVWGDRRRSVAMHKSHYTMYYGVWCAQLHHTLILFCPPSPTVLYDSDDQLKYPERKRLWDVPNPQLIPLGTPNMPKTYQINQRQIKSSS